jgi:LmbE family N-acetylglucosaminyl deacetylase
MPETPEPDNFYAPDRVLVIAAHADDIEFGAAGTVARWTDVGTRVTYCIVTDNSSGSNDPRVKKNALISTRKREQIASAKVVGVNDVRFLKYQDGVLQPTMELRKDLTRLIREIRPQIVVLMDPTMVYASDFGYINHPDHRAAGEAGMYAVFPSAGTRPIFPELLDEGLEPHDVDKVYLTLTMSPNLHIDITDSIERKKAALRCHASQLSDKDIEMVAGWNAEAGKEHGYGYAESFHEITLRSEEQETAS